MKGKREHKKAICSKCGNKFKVQCTVVSELMCHECADKLPKCDVCKIIVAPGYSETSLENVGNHHICGSCLSELSRKGFLHIERAEAWQKGLFLLPNGTVKEFTHEQEEEFFASRMNIKDFLKMIKSPTSEELKQRYKALKKARRVRRQLRMVIATDKRTLTI